jgi:hypothetical protein
MKIHSLSLRLLLPISIALASSGLRAAAGETPTQLSPIVVQGRDTDLLGTATSASQGIVGASELDARPFLRRGELLEVVPGVVITQHSGNGKANQYFLRGFNLDHGTDFALSVDGMPVNLRSHAHGQGYADLNFLIPELVQQVDYNKGPFFAEVGDFSAAGAAQFRQFSALARPFASLSVGENNFARLAVGGTRRAAAAETTAALEFTHDDGPWLLRENSNRFNGFFRHHWANAAGDYRLTAMAYHGKWRATDQIPQRAVDSGAVDRFGHLDDSDGGESERASLSFDATLKGVNATTQVNAYAIYYRLNLFSNFTYFLDDPVTGDQFNQRDRRWLAGGAVSRSWSGEFAGAKGETTVGLQGRVDFIGELGLHRTARRARTLTVRDDDVTEASAGLFVRHESRWRETLRTNGSAGYGFHSNDARGTTIRVDPADGVTPVERVTPLARSRGAEAGVRTAAIPGLVSSVSLWALDLDSELVFVGDAGGTEATGRTRRYGVEFANYYRATPWLMLDADLALTHARYRDEPVYNRIANSIDRVVTAGATFGAREGWWGALRLRYFGPQPLLEDNSVRAGSSLTWNGRIGWRAKDWDVALDVLNVFDRANHDIAYAYASRLRGEAVEGVDDVHFHPAEPRTFRFSIARRW